MELYYLVVQRSLWTAQLLILFLISTEGRHSSRRYIERRQLRGGHPPDILPDDHNITVHRNERAVLKCRVGNRGTKSVQWNVKDSSHALTIGKMTWTSDKHIKISYSKLNKSYESWDLVINSAQPRHSNTYECQISSIVTLRRQVHLTVLETLRKINPGISLTGKVVLDSRDTLNITCNATGAERAPASVDWFHDGIMIKRHEKPWDGRLRVYNYISEISRRSLISILEIEKTSLEDQGSYICRSSDREAASIDINILEDTSPPNRSVRNKELLLSNPNRAALSNLNIIVFILTVITSTR